MPQINPDVEARYGAAKRIAAEAAALAMQYFQRHVKVDRKEDASPVTIADREIERDLREKILQEFPHDSIVGEEEEPVLGSSAFRWILDPIDGTKSFIQGVPLFGTMVAVVQANRGVVGVVTFPALGVSIDAAVGGGAWETRADGTRVPAKVAATDRLSEGLALTTDLEGFIERGAENTPFALEEAAWFLRTWGDCYGYYLVATGRALTMIDPRLNIWDAAALQPILEEAGGTFTDWKGNPSIEAGEAVATNGHVLEEVLRILGGA